MCDNIILILIILNWQTFRGATAIYKLLNVTDFLTMSKFSHKRTLLFVASSKLIHSAQTLFLVMVNFGNLNIKKERS